MRFRTRKIFETKIEVFEAFQLHPYNDCVLWIEENNVIVVRENTSINIIDNVLQIGV